MKNICMCVTSLIPLKKGGSCNEGIYIYTCRNYKVSCIEIAVRKMSSPCTSCIESRMLICYLFIFFLFYFLRIMFTLRHCCIGATATHQAPDAVNRRH